MAEALAVVGIVASIVQLVDSTAKVLSRLNEFQKTYGEVPGSLKQVTAELPLLTKILQDAEAAVKDGRVVKESEDLLLPVIRGCTTQIIELDTVVKGILPKENASRVKKVMKSLDSMRKDEKIERIDQRIRGYISTLTFYYTYLTSRLQDSTASKLRDIRKWLKAPDPHENYHKALQLRQSNTGRWFIESEQFEKWNLDPSFIWLHGIPGCGKTILSSTIVENLLERAERDCGKVVAYFYFDFNDREKQDPELMIRSLLSQLSQKLIMIPAGLDTLFRSCDNGYRQPSPDSLFILLRQLIEEFPDVLIVLDALDECAERRKLMGTIQKISEWQLEELHILVTSRREGDIETSLNRLVAESNIIGINSDLVGEDIKIYIEERLSQDDRLQKWTRDSTTKDEIESALTKKAQGMFRWVACQLDILAQCRTKRKLHEALEDLPATLDETYNRILGAIKKEDSKFALCILQWLTYASRPLILAEVAHIVALDPERNPAYDEEDVLQEPREVLDICSSLITITDEDSVILAHYSVKEYLVSERIRKSSVSTYALEANICHGYIARCCLNYLLRFTDPHHFRPRREILDGCRGCNYCRLADYAAKSWFGHTKARDDEDQALLDLILKLLTTSYEVLNSWREIIGSYRLSSRHDGRARVSQVASSPIHVAALFGSSRIVSQLIDTHGTDVIETRSAAGTPLQVASREGQQTVVQLLLDKGADINAQTGGLGSAIQTAAEFGHESIVKLLLDNGAKIDILAEPNRWSDSEYMTALQAASGEGHETVVKLLLDRGADVHVRTSGRSYHSALHAAARNDRATIVEMLLDKDADVNVYENPDWIISEAFDTNGHDEGSTTKNRRRTVLLEAVIRRNEAIVQTLLDRGADVNAWTESGPLTALHGAIAQGDEAITKLLLSRGAKVNIPKQYRNSNTPLQDASVRGNIALVQLLLDGDAEVNAHGGIYGTALQAASVTQNKKIVQLLLDNGADVNMKGEVYGTALQAVATGPYDAIDTVELLLDKGANVNIQGGHYGTALQAAAGQGHIDMVKLLLDKDASVNIQGGHYGTALQAAAHRGDIDIVKLLLDKRASVHIQGGKYGTALQAAARGGRIDVVKLLLDKGVSVNIQGDKYGTTLQAAARGGDKRVVKLLLDHGADPNIKGGKYGSALQAARERVRVKEERLKDARQYIISLYEADLIASKAIVQMLLEHGAEDV